MRRVFIFPILFIFCLVACSTTKTVSLEALVNSPAGVTSRFVFPTSGSNAEAYLTRPAGAGPFPLMILLHGHTLGSIGAESMVPEAEAFASDLCYAGLAVSLPGYGATAVPPGIDPKITLNVVLDAVSLIKNLPWIDPTHLYLYGFSRGAFFTSLLANRIEGIEGIVLQSGAYDLNRLYQETPLFRSMLNPSGEQNPKLISILPEVSTWHAPTLVLHGGEDSSGFRPTGKSLTRLPRGRQETLPLRSLSQQRASPAGGGCQKKGHGLSRRKLRIGLWC